MEHHQPNPALPPPYAHTRASWRSRNEAETAFGPVLDSEIPSGMGKNGPKRGWDVADRRIADKASERRFTSLLFFHITPSKVGDGGNAAGPVSLGKRKAAHTNAPMRVSEACIVSWINHDMGLARLKPIGEAE